MEGDVGIDRVCPVTDNASCISKYRFTVIDNGSRLLDNEDGILGLWSGNIENLLDKY